MHREPVHLASHLPLASRALTAVLVCVLLVLSGFSFSTAVGVTAVLAVVGIAFHVQLATSREAQHREEMGWRFLCPGCLQYGEHRYACPACQAELEPFIIHTRGCYFNSCGRCRERLYGPDRPPLRAYCWCCGRTASLVHHRRRVRLIAVLGPQDLRRWPNPDEAPVSGGESWYVSDDGNCLTYVVDVSAPVRTEDRFPVLHAARAPGAIWIRAGAGALEAGRALDRYCRRVRLTQAQLRRVVVWMEENEPDPDLLRLVRARLGRVRLSVPADSQSWSRDVA